MLGPSAGLTGGSTGLGGLAGTAWPVGWGSRSSPFLLFNLGFRWRRGAFWAVWGAVLRPAPWGWRGARGALPGPRRGAVDCGAGKSPDHNKTPDFESLVLSRPSCLPPFG